MNKELLFKYSTAYKPIHFPWAFDLARRHESIHWVEDEVSLIDDCENWQRDLTENEREYLTGILRMFTQSDVNVAQSYYDWLIPLFKNNEIRNMLGSFACRESVHQRAYALLNDTLGLPDKEYRAFQYNDTLRLKNEYMIREEQELELKLVKQIFSEGVLLFGSFVMLLNFHRFGLMSGMVNITRWSLLDESVHVEGLTKLLKELKPKFIIGDVYDLANQAYEREAAFIDYVFNGHSIRDLSAEEVKQYIKYMIDRRLIQMGIKGYFNERDNPLPWVDDLVAGGKLENFFETKVTEYNASGMSGVYTYGEM